MLHLQVIVNLFLLTVVISAPVNTPIESTEDVAKYLVKFGYMTSLEDGQDMMVFSNALREFQREYGLNITGMLDSKTKLAMEMPRCKMSNINMTMTLKNTDMYRIYDKLSGMNIFTWSIQRFSNNLSREFQYKAVENGFQKWSDKCDVIFHRTDASNAHIRIYFDEIDKPGSILAYAFYPGSANSGQQTYDIQENWDTGEEGFALQYVVTHEAGHTFGLMHSSDDNAIMYTAYNYKGGEYTLTPDDEAACKKIFGEKKTENCFSPNGEVLLQDGRTVAMQYLQIGDRVQTSANKFSQVVTMLDRNEKDAEKFLIIRTKYGNTIELTKKHLIAVKSTSSEKDYIFAEEVLIGSIIYSVIHGKEIEDEVVHISSNIYQGYYAPLTVDGTIVINGIQASCYAEVRSQALAHWSMLPLRSLSYIRNMFFLSKTEDYQGVHWFGRFSKDYVLPIAKKLGVLKD